MSRQLVAVTIPIYKRYPDENELISLKQCFAVLHSHPIVFFAPMSLDITFYEDFCKSRSVFKVERFNDDYFKGIDGYNALMLSKHFYRAFNNYKYILIYQLDAFVFKDELEMWCKKGYDYIGAPYIFVDYDTYPIKVLTKFRKALKYMQSIFPGSYQYKRVGNGGFSLRKISKCLFLLNFKKLQPRLWTILMEDNFFSYWGNLMFTLFRLPEETEAAKFSIELDPQKTFDLIGKQLPFGCHAYLRYEPQFWSKYIPVKKTD